jgi:hypothetical protein
LIFIFLLLQGVLLHVLEYSFPAPAAAQPIIEVSSGSHKNGLRGGRRYDTEYS